MSTRRSSRPPQPPTIDLNADAGEGFGAWSLGDDAALLPHLTSVSIACGGHAGDPPTMARTVALAARLGVACGAHPGYPDLPGFGRRELAMSDEDLHATVLAQIGALAAIARAAGVALRHVKPHGALYHRATHDPGTAAAIVSAARTIDPHLMVMGPPGSALLAAAAASRMPVLVEAFADRRYEPDGRLRDRRLPGALLSDPTAAAEQARRIVTDGVVRTTDGSLLPIRAETLCVHGDTPGAPAIAGAVRAALEEAGIRVTAPGWQR